MKIINGKYKGRNFYMPKGIRPTQNLTRKALFDILGQDLSGVLFLDLFAGSGAVGIEALSCGAKMVVLVEKDLDNIALIEENLRLIRGSVYGKDEGVCEVLEGDSLAMIKEFSDEERKFDIIFVDPPYERELAKKTLKTLGGYVIVGPDSLVIIQHDQREKLPDIQDNLSLSKQYRYGKTRLSIFKVL